MDAYLESRWLQAELLKADLLARVAALPEGARSLPPKPGQWSPLQILSHVLKAEQFVASYASTKLDQPKPRANPLLIGLLCRVMGAGIPLPAPEVMEPDPAPMPLDELTREWNQEREKLHGMLASTPPDEPFGLHPIFGVVTTRQVAEMIVAHTSYHVKRFPKTGRPSL